MPAKTKWLLHVGSIRALLETLDFPVIDRQRLQAQVVEVVVGREELDVGEVLGRLEDAGDLESGLGGVVKCGVLRAS